MGLWLAIVAITAYLGLSKKTLAQSVEPTQVETEPENAMGLPDILPEFQGGNFSTEHDDTFKEVSDEKGVPFALLKAHALRESSLKRNAVRQEPATSKRPPSASYGLMQILWWPNSQRFRNWGYDDDFIRDGSILYDPYVNVSIAAELILDNWRRMGNLRDIVNAYNTGVKESVRQAPFNYVDSVLDYYSTLIGRKVL